MPSQRSKTIVHVSLATVVAAVLLQELRTNPDRVVRLVGDWTAWAALVVLSALLVGIHLVVENKDALFGTVEETLDKNGGQLVAEVLRSHGERVVGWPRAACAAVHPDTCVLRCPVSGKGVKFLFTLVGGHISPILVSAKRKGVRVIDVRHEVTAVFAADAVARLTGVPGVVAVTAGPGLTNTVTAVKNAQVRACVRACVCVCMLRVACCRVGGGATWDEGVCRSAGGGATHLALFVFLTPCPWLQMAESPVVLISGAAATLAKGRGALQDIDQMAIMRPLVKYAATCNSVRDIVPVMRKAFQEACSGA